MSETAAPSRADVGPTNVRWVLVLLVLLVFLGERMRIGLAVPVPWADEGSFLFPALGFRDHWSLYAPEINPERHVMWMPPAFMVLEGLVFKIVPFSLDAARTLSALFLAGAFACAAGLFRKYRTAAVLPLLFPVFLLSPIFLVVGNCARMEALVLLMASGAFLLLAEGRAAGLALLAFGPLVHPNALFPLAVGVPYFLFVRKSVRRPARVDLYWFGAVLFAWLAYSVYVARHLPGFREDMLNQLKFKTLISMEDGGPFKRIFFAPVLGPLLAIAALPSLARRVRVDLGPLLALAAAFGIQTMVASGWLYEVYMGFSTLLVSIAAVEIAAAWLETSSFTGRMRKAALVAVFALTGYVGFQAEHSTFATRSLARGIVSRRGVQPPYYTPEDVDVVGRYLTRLSEERPITVQFITDGEGLVFERFRSPRLGFVQQTFYIGGFSVAVVHDSLWLPSFVHDLEYLNIHALHHFVRPRVTTIRERDGTERWTVFEWDCRSVSKAFHFGDVVH